MALNLTTRHIQLSRIARRARFHGQHDLADVAQGRLRDELAGCYVGDGPTLWNPFSPAAAAPAPLAIAPLAPERPARRGEAPAAAPAPLPEAAELRRELDALRRDVDAFTWPQVILDAADDESDPDQARTRLRHAREEAQRNVREGIRLARVQLDQGNLEAARTLTQRAVRRWARFNGQEEAIGREAARDQRGWGDRLDDALRDAEQSAGNAWDQLGETLRGAIVPLVLGVGLALFLGRR